MGEPTREWTVRECELGGDLRDRSCHTETRCSIPGSCNVAGHYCECPCFVVADAAEAEDGDPS